MKNAKRIQELRDQISKLMPKAESGEQWAEICRIEAAIVALGGDTNGL